MEGGPGFGFDDLQGGEGNDALNLETSEFGGNAAGGEGDDLLIGSDTSSFNSLDGSGGNDTLQAGDGGASLLGDGFEGGVGDDRLVGGIGDDQFTGGAPAPINSCSGLSGRRQSSAKTSSGISRMGRKRSI